MANPAGDIKNMNVKSGIRTANESLENISHDVGQRAGEIVSQVSGSVSEYYENGRRFVKDNPVKGVAYAAAAGVVVGSLLTLALRQRD